MPAANFKGRFASLVLNQSKRTTIRPGARFKVGDAFMGYFGMRTKRCVLLVEGTVLHADAIVVYPAAVSVLGALLSDAQLAAVAEADGFGSVLEFLNFFMLTYDTGKVPLVGQLVGWSPVAVEGSELRRRLKALSRALAGLPAKGTRS